MRVRAKSWLGVWLGLLAAGLAAAAPEPVLRVPDTSLQFPRQVDDFTAQNASPAAPAGAPASVLYLALDRVRLEVQVQAAPPQLAAPTLKEPLAKPLTERYEKAKKELALQVAKEGVQGLQLVLQDRVQVDGKLGPVALRAAWRGVVQETFRYDELRLLLVAGQYLQFHASYPEDLRTAAEASLFRFYRQFPWSGTDRLDHAAMQATIAEFLRDPEGSARPLEALKRFAEESDDVAVLMAPELFPWLGPGKHYLYADLLMGGYLAGNVRVQLQQGKAKNDSHAGMLGMLEVYAWLQGRHPEYRVAEIEDYREQEQQGKLRRALQLRELLLEDADSISL